MSVRAFIHFHASCLDGVVSAAIASELVRRSWKATRVAFRPVGYQLGPHWLARHLPPHSAVVDYLFHPEARLWADHHPTAFTSPQHRSMLDTPPTGARWIYDVDAPSCASLLNQELRQLSLERATWFEEIVAWCDRIDSARYESPAEAVTSDAPAVRVSRALAGETSSERMSGLIERVLTDRVDRLADIPWVRTRWETVSARSRRALGAFAPSCRLEAGVVVFEVSGHAAFASRYAPFYFFPDADYSVGLVHHERHLKLTAMRNPWKDFESLPLGEMLTRWGGGGHHRVGSAIFLPRDLAQARDALADLARALRDRQIPMGTAT